MYIYISIQIYSKYMNIEKKRNIVVLIENIYKKDHKTIAQSEKLQEGRKTNEEGSLTGSTTMNGRSRRERKWRRERKLNGETEV